jgi:hypothetical protein
MDGVDFEWPVLEITHDANRKLVLRVENGTTLG